MCFISWRRLRMYFLRRSYSKWGKDEDRVPLNLQDCLDKPGIKKSTFCRPYIIVALIVPIVFYMFYYRQETHNVYEITLPRPRAVYMEIYPKLQPKVIVTEKVSSKIKEKIYLSGNITQNDKTQWYDLKFKMKNMGVRWSPLSRIQKKVTNCVVAHKGNVSINMSQNVTDPRVYNLMGGYYKPSDCRPQHKVGILVPYRDKDKQLAVFLYNIHPFLIHQNIEYRLFLVEQLPKDMYNRGRLLNAGFIEIQKLHRWNCVLFHDLDLLPLDDRILYSCPLLPRHLCATIEGLKNKTSSRSLFGGVTVMSLKHFKEVNGFSNLYWGFGGEDNDLFWRIKAIGLGVTRLNKTVARYMSLSHTEPPLNPNRFNLLSSASTRYRKDGLTTLEYNVISYNIRPFYTHIVIDINPKKENITRDPPEKINHGLF